VERWLAQHLAFAVERYLKNNDSVIFTQRIFHCHFSIHRNDSVASRNTLLLWVRNVRETSSAAKRKPTERKPAVRTPENIKRFRQIFVGSPRRSESRNALALRMSGRTVRWILHRDLNSHPYKMIIVQAFNYQDIENWRTLCQNLLKDQGNDDNNHIIMADEANFHLSSYVNSRNWCYWAIENTLAMFVRNLYILRMLCLLLCSIFWVDRSLVLWRRGRQSSNRQYGDALLISGTGFAGNWCWSPDRLVSAGRGNGLHCEECNASSQRGIPS